MSNFIRKFLFRDNKTNPEGHFEDLDTVYTPDPNESQPTNPDIPLEPGYVPITGHDGKVALYVEVNPTNQSGNLGNIHRGYSPELKRYVAVKIIKEKASAASGQLEAESPVLVERMKLELAAGIAAFEAARKNAVQVLALIDTWVAELNRSHFLVMDWVETEHKESQTVQDMIDHQLLNPTQVVVLLSQMAKFVELYAQHGWLHFDLKPSNCFVNKLWRLKVFDFNFSEQLSNVPASSEPTALNSDTTIGTPAYTSPERVAIYFEGTQGNHLDSSEFSPLTLRSEVYSLGIIAYELITSRLPRTGSVSAVLNQIKNTDGLADDWDGHRFAIQTALEQSTGHPPSSDTVDKLAQCLDKAMRKNPADRYATPSEFVADLIAILGVDFTQKRAIINQLKQQKSKNYRGVSKRKPQATVTV